MDWIERWFGLSPDGGDGSIEALYVVALSAAMVLILGRHYFARFWRRSGPDRKRSRL
jgi:hypothetical protein